MTTQEAYPIVLAKWEYILKQLKINKIVFISTIYNNGKELANNLYREKFNLDNKEELLSGCAYCELFIVKSCIGCPLVTKKTTKCTWRDSIYDRFKHAEELNNFEEAIDAAKIMIKHIKRTKPENI